MFCEASQHVSHCLCYAGDAALHPWLYVQYAMLQTTLHVVSLHSFSTLRVPTTAVSDLGCAEFKLLSNQIQIVAVWFAIVVL